MIKRSAAAPHIAIATCAQEPSLHGEEGEILPALRAVGVEAEAVIWNDGQADWSRFDAVVIRSTWDYFEHYDEFRAWLDRVERVTRLHNSASIVRWNSDKMYLRELERRGVPVVPTVFCEARTPASLATIVRAAGWDRAVIKPSISGGAHRTYRVEPGEAMLRQTELDGILATSGALVQPFFPEIQTEGEWSFVFFDGALSHTVLKVPVGDDYRVQTQFGGTFKLVEPEPWLVERVQRVMAALPERPAYARIDGLRRDGEFFLMEAELIEPYLYLSAAPGSLDTCVRLLEKLARAS